MSETKKGVIALIALALVFATMGVFVRPLGTGFALFEQTYLRIGLALLISIIVFWNEIAWKKFLCLSLKDALVLTFRAVTLYLGVALFTDSILHSNYSDTYFLNNLPLLPVFGYLFLREHLSLRTLGWIGVAFVGTMLVSLTDLAHLSLGAGALSAFLAMLAFDASYTARRWHTDRLSDKESTVGMFFIGTLALFLISLSLGEPLPSSAQFSPFILLMLFLSAIFNVMNLYLSNYGFGRVKVGIAGTIITLETVFALLYAVFLYGQTPSIQELLGGALILMGVWQINRKSD